MAWEKFLLKIHIYIKFGGEPFLRPFSEALKLSISLDQSSKVSYNLFIVCQAEGYQNILKLSCRPLAFTSYKDFYIKQRQAIN